MNAGVVLLPLSTRTFSLHVKVSGGLKRIKYQYNVRIWFIFNMMTYLTREIHYVM